VKARHPLLTGAVVPISLDLGGEFDILLITGPNTGGKTVALKTAGLLSLMAQAGLFVPADEGSVVAVFERVQADIGDEQSLQQSLSTFSSHISRIVRMLRDADSCSLILLDELGAGTDPQEGAAIARALLDFLRERGAYVVATTHYPELKSYAESTPRVQNASVEFDVSTLSPTYRLMIGTPGRSNALAIAERLGMPHEVLDAARAYVTPHAREVIESALSLPTISAPPPPVMPEPEIETPSQATVVPGAEVLVPRLGLPGRVLAIRDDTVEIEVLGRRVHMPLAELEGATRPM